MRTYVMTSGTIFGLVVLAHVWRVVVEGPHVVLDPFFAGITALAAALCVWAWLVVRRSSKV